MTRTQAIIVLHLAELADVTEAFGRLGADEVGTAIADLIQIGHVAREADGDLWSTFPAQDEAWAIWAA